MCGAVLCPCFVDGLEGEGAIVKSGGRMVNDTDVEWLRALDVPVIVRV
jgi:hypothetical protein